MEINCRTTLNGTTEQISNSNRNTAQFDRKAFHDHPMVGITVACRCNLFRHYSTTIHIHLHH